MGEVPEDMGRATEMIYEKTLEKEKQVPHRRFAPGSE
jgi:hypothetical protein